MGASLRKFVSRAPRYTLRPADNHLMRFAHEDERGQIFTTKIHDVSTTGVSFVVDRDDAPFIQERVKMEIPLEDGEQIAWWGRVVRIEEFSDHKWYLKKEDFFEDRRVLVAVHFEGLPTPYAAKISRTLDKKFEEVAKEKKKEALKNWTAMWRHYTWELLFYVGVVLTGIYILWALSRPGGNYDAERGSPWGQRVWSSDDK